MKNTVNIADILCFPDEAIPRIQAENLTGNRLPVTRDDILRVLEQNPGFNRYQVAEVLGVSVPTVNRHWRMAKAWLYAELDRT